MQTTEKQLIELEKSYWQAMKAKDTATTMKLTADPSIVTGPQGVASFDKASFEKMMNKPQSYTLDDYRLGDDFQVRMLGDDVGVVAYTVHQRLTVDGKPIELDCVESSTWTRKGDGWVCAMHSEAVAGDPFGRDKAPGGAGKKGTGATA